ncbi:caspase, EACC1-associated type [Amycolatopsis pigmentata]|uniref:Caspase family protein n=1 Tax=Amycolatopsis pigmentata TaxID=450801 RepID=A0ABW5FR24_9PSEU
MTSADPLHVYADSRAALIGTWDYKYLESVDPAARNSLGRMTDLLTGPLCGWPEDRVEVIGNERECGNLPHRLMRLYQGITDVALFYFVGHGQIYDDELCLALGESPYEASSLRLTAGLQFRHVRQALLACDAETKIVILDCCYSGIATKSGQALSGTAAEIMDRTAGTGAFTMAACEPYYTGWFEPGEPGAPVQTYFTKHLVDTIEAGLPREGAGLSLGAVFTATAEALASARRPRPTRSVRHDADQFVIARNTHQAATQHMRTERGQCEGPERNEPSSNGFSLRIDRRHRRKYATAGGILGTLGILAVLVFSFFKRSDAP